MNQSEVKILEDLKSQLREKFHRDCVDAYLINPKPEAIVKSALAMLEGEKDEAGQS